MQKITPNLWFDKNGEEAANFYTSLFPGGKIISKTHYLEAGKEVHGQEPGSIMTVTFEIEGYQMLILNGGPYFKPNPSISFFVNSDDKEEVRTLWSKLIDGGKALMEISEDYGFSKLYGWVEDKFGVSWQLMLRDEPVVPAERIVPSLMFVGSGAGQAKEAIEFYTSVLPDSSVGASAPYPEGQGARPGALMYADFTLAGQKFAAMDGDANDHSFTFTEAISLSVECKDQAELDEYWNKLTAVPESEQCGWLKDKFGVSWQIVPAGWEAMYNDPDQEKANRAMAAMMQMHKLDIQKLRDAFEGK